MSLAGWAELPALKGDDYTPLYVQLSRALTDFIHKNGLIAGRLLPSEKELTERYGLSRTTVRQAIQALEAEGWVQKIQGKGTYVAQPKYRTLVQGMVSVEESLARQGIAVKNLLLESAVVSLPAWAVGLGWTEAVPVRLIRRLRLVEDRPWAIEVRAIPEGLARRFQEEDFRDRPIFDLFTAHPDLKIWRVVYSITASALQAREAQELDVPVGGQAIVRTGWYFNQAEEPVMAGQLTFLALRTALRYEFRREDRNWGIVEVV